MGVNLLQSYPAGVDRGDLDETLQAYYDSYSYPIFALREALLRFPDAEQAEGWRWSLAYDQALTGDEEFGDTYSALIADNLNRSQVDLEELYAWFPIQEPRMQLFMVEAPIPARIPGELCARNPGRIGRASGQSARRDRNRPGGRQCLYLAPS